MSTYEKYFFLILPNVSLQMNSRAVIVTGSRKYYEHIKSVTGDSKQNDSEKREQPEPSKIKPCS